MSVREKRLPDGWVVDRSGLLHPSDPDKWLWSVCLHESGHAVVAHEMGFKVEKLLVRKSLSGLAQYRHSPKFCPVKRAMIALAGHEAECLFSKRPRTLLPESDVDFVMLRLHMCWDAVNLCGHNARRCVWANRKRLHSVARALREKRSLSRRQFLKALRA